MTVRSRWQELAFNSEGPLSLCAQGLYEQFRRVANFYFLLIAGISLSPFRYMLKPQDLSGRQQACIAVGIWVQATT